MTCCIMSIICYIINVKHCISMMRAMILNFAAMYRLNERLTRDPSIYFFTLSLDIRFQAQSSQCRYTQVHICVFFYCKLFMPKGSLSGSQQSLFVYILRSCQVRNKLSMQTNRVLQSLTPKAKRSMLYHNIYQGGRYGVGGQEVHPPPPPHPSHHWGHVLH